MSKYIDVSLPIKTNQMQYPTDIACKVKQNLLIDKGDIVNTTTLHLSAHTGTHIDAPYHFFNDGKKVDELDLAHFIGKAKVFDFTDKMYFVDRPDLEAKHIEKGDIILLKTTNSERIMQDEFFEDFVYLTQEAALFLVEKQIITFGLDFISIDAYDNNDYPCHYALLGNGIVIIEGLNLGAVTEGEYEMLATPLKIQEGDGAPARVVLKQL